MKEHFKAHAALWLALILMISLLSACGTTDRSSAASSGTTGASVSSETPAAEPTPDAEIDNPEPEQAKDSVTMPLTEETVELKYWIPWPPVFTQWIEKAGDALFYQTMEKLSNVHVDIIEANAAATLEEFNLVLTSGDLPDMMLNFLYFYGLGGDSAIEEELIVNMADYSDYMPSYTKLINSDQDYSRSARTDNGNIAQAFQIYKDIRTEFGGMTRKDWLDDLGLDVPETYDEWHEALTLFKTEKNADAAFMPGYLGVCYGTSFVRGYNVSGLSYTDCMEFYQIDGDVFYSPIDDNYRAYLEMMHEWYEEGLVWQDFNTYTSSYMYPDESMITTGRSGMFYTSNMQMSVLTASAQDENFELCAFTDPVVNKGDTLHIAYSTSDFTYQGVSITTGCEEDLIPIAAQWIDYRYSDDGYLLMNYGVEGETYEMVDGKPVFTELVTNNPDGANFNVALTVYTTNREFGLYDTMRTAQGSSPAAVEAMELWSTSDNAYVYPNTSMTADEAAEFDDVMNEIHTLACETTLKFIMGEQELNDDTWSAYVSLVESMGLQKAVDCLEAALVRYNNR